MDGVDVSALAGNKSSMGLTAYLPWWFKLVAKLVLARLPLPYGFWRNLGLFRHGQMDVPARAFATYEKYFQRAGASDLLSPGFNSLELGPGDSILSGLVAKAYGAEAVWLVDAGEFARTDYQACEELERLLHEQGKAIPGYSNLGSVGRLLEQTNVHYLTNGTKSLSEISTESIHFFWSQVVLEHVPRHEFSELLSELRRVAAPGAIGVHSVDFRDHLSGGLNNLRFSESVWESRVFASSGFYTNRLRPGEMISAMREAGFSVEVISSTRWPQMPVRRSQMAKQFRTFPDDDFMVAEMELIMRPVPMEDAGDIGAP